jgi:hypothetical protein
MTDRGAVITTANISTIDRTLQKLCKFGFLEDLRETTDCPSTYFNLWFLCEALKEVLSPLKSMGGGELSISGGLLIFSNFSHLTTHNYLDHRIMANFRS